MKEKVCDICKSEGKTVRAVGYISYPNMRKLRMELCRIHKNSFPEMSREEYVKYAMKIKGLDKSPTLEDLGVESCEFINLAPCELPNKYRIL